MHGKFSRRPKTVCFISETGRTEHPLKDPSVRYRCYHPAEALLQQGHFCSIYSATQFYANPCLDFDVYVFHRPNMARPSFDAVTDYLLKSGRVIIADYDDLIFGDAEVAMQSSAVKNETLGPEQAIAAFASNLAGLRKFDKVTTSTEPLARRVLEANPGVQVAVVPNVLPPSILDVHEALGTPFRSRPQTAIGYFAGTRSHNRDFPIVEEVLHRVLSENPEFSLLVVGPVAVPQAIATLPNVNTVQAVNFLRLPSLMTMCSTVIAPLEESEFNNCKSRVKFLEAALTGCRLVASPIPDMQSIGPEHLILAEDKDEWYEALSFPPSPEDYRDQAARNFHFLQSNDGIDGLKMLGELE